MRTLIWGVAALVLVIWAAQRSLPAGGKRRVGSRPALPVATVRNDDQGSSASSKGEDASVGADTSGNAGGGD